MSSRLSSAAILQRDGTGQAKRQMPALDPGFMPLEERSLADWINFAQQYATQLHFFDENNNINGTWEAFLRSVEIPQLLAYIEDPHAFTGNAETISNFSRPHLVLFISFLQLLGFIKDQLNEFTQRHLH